MLSFLNSNFVLKAERIFYSGNLIELLWSVKLNCDGAFLLKK